MADSPCFVTPMKWCGCAAARMASIAIPTRPSVPFFTYQLISKESIDDGELWWR